jgi:ABC-type transporter Mla MlaB component
MDILALHVRGPLRRPDLPGLFTRVCAQMAAAQPRVVLCEVSECDADVVALAALTRLQLAARRRGCEVRLRGATGEMLALVAFLGLETALPNA